MMDGSPIKLRSGEWGVRARGKAAPGDVVNVVAKSGKRWTATVARVVWSGPDRDGGGTVSLCATEKRERGGYGGLAGGFRGGA